MKAMLLAAVVCACSAPQQPRAPAEPTVWLEPPGELQQQEPLEAARPTPVSGAWIGEVSEGISYQVCMNVPKDLRQPGSVTYFDGLSCGGEIRHVNEAAGLHTFVETLTFGNVANGGACADDGRIETQLNPDGSLDWDWFPTDSDEVQVSGTLRRVSSCP